MPTSAPARTTLGPDQHRAGPSIPANTLLGNAVAVHDQSHVSRQKRLA